MRTLSEWGFVEGYMVNGLDNVRLCIKLNRDGTPGRKNIGPRDFPATMLRRKRKFQPRISTIPMWTQLIAMFLSYGKQGTCDEEIQLLSTSSCAFRSSDGISATGASKLTLSCDGDETFGRTIPQETHGQKGKLARLGPPGVYIDVYIYIFIYYPIPMCMSLA